MNPDSPLTIYAMVGIREEFMKMNLPPGASGEISRVVNRMALVAAAGEIAVHYSILPWAEGEAIAAASRCCRDWLSGRGGVGASDIGRAIDQIRAFLVENTPARFPRLSKKDEPIDERAIKRAGWVKGEVNSDNHEWWIFKDVFRKEICKGYDYRQIEKSLINKQFLIEDGEGNPTSPRSVPNVGKTRVYRISSKIIWDDANCVLDVPVVPGAKAVEDSNTSIELREEQDCSPKLFHDQEYPSQTNFNWNK
jgi:putative DNA primase/helicase